jgi:acyl-CoA thioester hydrolase
MKDASRTRIDVPVRYFETDQMGVVHHVNYLVWFELGRTKLCADAGFPYAEIERRGYRLMNSEIRARYHRPAVYGDTVALSCWISSLASRAVHFEYEIHRDDELLVSGATEHVWIGTDSSKPCRAPDDIREALVRFTPPNGDN